jgi:hypothetical protein
VNCLIKIQKRILIIGAGRRVINDVIPALKSIRFDLDSLIVVRQQKKSLERFPELRIETDLVLTLNVFKPHIVICCIPVSQVPSITSILSNYSIPNVLIDTPVYSNSKILFNKGKIENLRILEDAALIPWIESIRKKFASCKFLFIYRSLYEYHGLVLLREIFGLPIRRIGLPKFLNKHLVFLKINKTFIFWVRKRDYRKGFMIFFSKGTSKILGNPFLVDFQKEFFTNFSQNLDIQINLEYLKEIQIQDYGNLRFIKDMLFWKRVGLAIGLNSIINHELNCFITIDEMTRIEDLLK